MIPMPPRHESRGFGLVELMITLTIMAGMLFMVFATLRHSQQQSGRIMNVADERQMARTAIQLIERETRMAGSGWGKDTVQAGYNGTSWSFYAVNPGPGAINSSDSLRLVGAWQASTYLSPDSMLTSSSTMKVNSTAGFSTGDFIIITSPTSSHLFQVTGIGSSPPTLLHANTSKYNTGQALWPLGGYKANSTNIYKVTIATYKYDSTSYKRPAIVRTELGQAPQVVAYNVDGFRVWYEMQDGTRTRNPGLLTFVNKVTPVVYTKVTDPRLPTLRDSVWASIRPRTF